MQLFRNTSHEWIIVKVNGVEIESTPGHKYYLLESNSWVSAKDLQVGTKVLLSDGGFGEIERVKYKYYNTAQTTYNFEVADFHTYYVSDSKVLVHNKCYLDPNDIRYTQDSISNRFKDGSSVDDMIDGLKNGNISVDDVSAIRVFKQNGKIYSLDNRRLYAFKQAGMKSIQVSWVNPTSPNITKEIAWKFTTLNDGLSIVVR